ncbi:nuclear transport factor 2 family protein [Alphaproteobacteria bacterium]|nr:nuclear transport factor 2 family protein [Alphaproteobacteria bacterium]
MNGDGPGTAVGGSEYIEIQRFLYHEAALLDCRDYSSWLGLLTDDIIYRVTTQLVRPADEEVERFTIIDELADSLTLRVEQLAHPKLTHAENPATLTRRFLSNFHITHAASPDSYDSVANLMVYRNRTGEPAGGFLVGVRHDVLRRVDGALRIADRCVNLDETVLRDGTLSILL